MSGADACAAAGFQRSSDLANRLDERPEVITRIQQLQTKFRRSLDERREQAELLNTASELGVTPRWVIEQLKENVTLAQDANQFGAANSSLKLISELIGMNKPVDPNSKKDAQQKLPGDLREMSERLNALPPLAADGEFQLDQLDASDEEAMNEALEELDEEDEDE
jgi:hypothetical protein